MLLLVFTINRNKFGIPLDRVAYIAENIGYVDSAAASGHIRGTTILRDEVTLVYDLASRFGYDSSKAEKSVIVVSNEKSKLAIEVEKIDGIKFWEECICEEIPEIVKNTEICVQYAVSFQEELILMLDIDKLLDAR